MPSLSDEPLVQQHTVLSSSGKSAQYHRFHSVDMHPAWTWRVLFLACIVQGDFSANSMTEYYLYPDLNTTWSLTRTFCENNGWNMVKADTTFTSHFLQISIDSGQYWLGLQYSSRNECVASGFEWTDCTSLNNNPWGITAQNCSGEQCVYFDSNGWNVSSCDEHKNIICQHTQGQCSFHPFKFHTNETLPVTEELGASLSFAECERLCLNMELNVVTKCWIIHYSLGSCRLLFVEDNSTHLLLQSRNSSYVISDDYYVKSCHKVNVSTGQVPSSQHNYSTPCIDDEVCYFENIAESRLQALTHAVNFTVDVEAHITECKKLCLNVTTKEGYGCWIIDRKSSSVCRLYFITRTLPHFFWEGENPIDTLFVKRCPDNKDKWDTATKAPVDEVDDSDAEIQELRLDKKETSNYRRKFISVYESRASAVSMGVCGSIFIGFLIGTLVCTDCPVICRHARKIGLRNIRKRNICTTNAKRQVKIGIYESSM